MSLLDNFKIPAINTVGTFNLTLWRQRQLFWARDKSAIWRSTKGFTSLLLLKFFKMQIKTLMIKTYSFGISNICTSTYKKIILEFSCRIILTGVTIFILILHYSTLLTLIYFFCWTMHNPIKTFPFFFCFHGTHGSLKNL